MSTGVLVQLMTGSGHAVGIGGSGGHLRPTIRAISLFG